MSDFLITCCLTKSFQSFKSFPLHLYLVLGVSIYTIVYAEVNNNLTFTITDGICLPIVWSLAEKFSVCFQSQVPCYI